MARLNSFYFPAEDWPSLVGDTVLFKGNEARHMLTVLRTETGQTVRLFDGEGCEGLFLVKEIDNKRALLEALQINELQRPETGVTLAIGWGKSKRRNYLFEKAVELRASGIAFWDARRSQGKIPDQPKDTWREKCLQAAKQCGNPYIPELITLGDISELVAFAQSFDHCYIAWESEKATTPLAPVHMRSGKCLVVIGPEGGMEDKEAGLLLDTGFEPVTLGDSILRWETAAAYCLSLSWFARQESK
ncbi:RsmE family RNA methyltransferase [Pseudodesulfovibrio sp. zrk46]|uniref:RsmE family RNA methyltransferase n=1 Tax=Pseudodesulfovibrio sp. zrk46 TaxID=2725288 RepID=UPI00144A0671|nr:RsmE family RNA methyltransferase [Pseudodesulfovibrio sp. zrk46]QJB57717.1 16S rRNA (uracil(1498)-N(3))-methyltransferase [Pseudodesulfovibrio sp. zrk46]